MMTSQCQLQLQQPQQILNSAEHRTNGSRIRPRMEMSDHGLESSSQSAYRIHFSCENKGRYFRSSKRQIRWVFGFTNLTAIKQGKVGEECRGEEHEVELIWSLKSRKTRLFWNKKNISNFFREENKPDVVDFAWMTRSGANLQIAAHSHLVLGQQQYDLLIDGVSFFRLPTIAYLGSATAKSETSDVRAPEVTSSIFDGLSDLGSVDHLDNTELESFGDKLERAGLLSASSATVEFVDELHNELYSSVIDVLRREITEYLPQTEEMISRAITYAFFLDGDSLNSDSTSDFSTHITDPYQVEVDAIWDAFEWARLNIDCAPRPDAEDLALSFLQKQVDLVFYKVRSEELSSDAALSILLSVAAALGLQFSKSIPRTTIIVDQLPVGTNVNDLYHHLSAFGSIKGVAVTKRTVGFGLCRFLPGQGVEDLMSGRCGKIPEINGVQPRLLPVTEFMDADRKKRHSLHPPPTRSLISEDVLFQEPECTPTPLSPRFLRLVDPDPDFSDAPDLFMSNTGGNTPIKSGYEKSISLDDATDHDSAVSPNSVVPIFKLDGNMKSTSYTTMLS